MNKWRFFAFRVDMATKPLTPNAEEILHSCKQPEALLSVTFSKGSEGTFIYRISRPNETLLSELRQREAVIQAEMSQPQGDHCGVIVHTELNDEHLIANLMGHPIIIDTPIEFVSRDVAEFRITAPDDIIDDVYCELKEEAGVALRKVGYCRPSFDDPLQILTQRQREILQTAVQGGYYNIPREIDNEDIGEQFGISAHTASEHIRKIELKLIEQMGLRDGTTSTTATHGVMKDVHG